MNAHKLILARIYYYLLDWKERNIERYAAIHGEKRLVDLLHQELMDLFAVAAMTEFSNVRVKIEVEGGNVTEIVSSGPVEVMIYDLDNKKQMVDPEEYQPFFELPDRIAPMNDFGREIE